LSEGLSVATRAASSSRARPTGRSLHIFADESGNLDFGPKRGASRFFILGTVTIPGTLALGEQLLDLRRGLAKQGLGLDSPSFHASEDKQAVRDEVFGLLAEADFRFDCTVFEKCKTRPHLSRDRELFYKTAWYYHFKYVAPRVTRSNDDLLVVAASLMTKKQRTSIREAIVDVVDQLTVCKRQVAFWPVESDPCLQVADYMCWAVYRKYERNDCRSYELIQRKIRSEFNIYRGSSTTYY
jgi:uncharacterized protein DUF3800